MNKFTELLAKKHALSPLCVNREKISTEDILGIELTVEDVDIKKDIIIDGEAATFSIYTFKECPGKYVYGGMKLTDIAESLLEMSVTEHTKIADMNVKVMLKQITLKNKNTFTDVEFI